MEISHRNNENVLIITLNDKSLNSVDTIEFKNQVISLINEYDATRMIFELNRLQFIDSSGLGAFLSILRALSQRGGSLKLVGMKKPVRAIFELVSMHKIFEIYSSTEDAIKSFTSNVRS